jgi:all-trans-retinol 13,14-reductase
MSPTQREYKTPSGIGVWKNQLIKQFPDERKAIESFFSMVNRVKSRYKDFISVKLVPRWIVNLLSLFGLPRFLSDFFALSDRTLKDVIEVIICS